MRLAVVDEANPEARSDVIKTLLYRPDSFGRPFSDATERAMRGRSEWSAGERELFAAFTSLLNQCPF